MHVVAHLLWHGRPVVDASKVEHKADGKTEAKVAQDFNLKVIPLPA
jgi:hypothetical protein